jgi:hypothetical protein
MIKAVKHNIFILKGNVITKKIKDRVVIIKTELITLLDYTCSIIILLSNG